MASLCLVAISKPGLYSKSNGSRVEGAIIIKIVFFEGRVGSLKRSRNQT
jgi:hypothetical protein